MIPSGRPAGVYLWDEADSALLVPERLITEDQRRVGPGPLALWVSLRYLALREAPVPDPIQRLVELTGRTPEEVRRDLDRLEASGLLEREARGWRLLSGSGSSEGARSRPEPPGPAAAPRPEDGEAGADEPPGAVPVDEAADLQAVVAIYHKWIGLLGEAQYERLRYWLETMGMSADVIAVAVRQAAVQAPRPRMSYVEGILRNWYNDGVRTLEDLADKGQLDELLDVPGRRGSQRGPGAPFGRPARPPASRLPEGAANASAYRPVDPGQVARWKELYPDEY
ncbi:DnaD domain-containing protein [Limnochorda pilosa]|uniref:DnaB/C C-terminal domain-containing protein n=1 Tax=Limnochorda pilosa TaxID=1555112 RepID=A0A0K2SQM0_LIMPI|nr:DnaD domain protein [Limnochorda pilosa]BAS29428.1 hypothetical protein LIP_3620 [Limnochorda pilosa]